jgi:ATP/maltotriose-dependent transcriptional regulator MalT
VQTTVLGEAREAYARGQWDVAFDRFRSAAAEAELAVDDLTAYADAAWWLGENDTSLTLSEQVYRRCLQGDRVPAAARIAIEVGFLWFLRGESTIGSGWISRATRLLRDVPECAAHGYLQHLQVLEALGDGRFDDATTLAHEMQVLAERCDDDTLFALALALEGVATVKLGQVAEGLGLLDEAMLPVRAGTVSPNWAGNLYCQLMGLFFELADLSRARAWTDATERWCDQYSNAAMFSGICRVHRAQLLHVEGAWEEAEQRALRACRDLADMNVEVVAAGQYQVGEIRRVQGDLEAAEEAYARAHELGRDPQPGLALLRLAQGRPDVADASIRTALAGVVQSLPRVPLRAAQAEVARVAEDAQLAAEIAAELRQTADTYGTPGLEAIAQQTAGLAALLAGEAERSLPALRDASRRWRDLEAPYDAARTHVLLSEAMDALGDHDAADRERTVAEATFAELGAAPDLAALTRSRRPAQPPGGLTERELEVLTWTAAGKGNRSIAERLTISERTVERHVSNIFLKLDVSSRTEAARFAYRHGLDGTP